MRIAYLLTSLGAGGAEREVLALAARMGQRGHVVSLLVLREQQAEEWPTGLPSLHLGIRKNPWSAAVGLLGAWRFLRGFRPDILHGHGFHANVVARLLGLAVRGPLVLSTIHNVYEGGWLRMLAYRATDGLCPRTTAVSEAVARRFAELKAVPRRKCHVIANAIEIGELTPDPKRRNCVRNAMNAGEDFVWMAAGRLVPAKDYPNLLRAFARVRAACGDVRLWIAGEGRDEETARLRALASGLGMDDGISWLGLRRDLSDLMDAADGFVLSSAWEGMPLALMEAMAMAKPVIAADVGGVRELVGAAGRMVPSRDSEALAAAMLEVMRQSQRARQALGSSARRRIEENFSMEARAAEWEKFYFAALGDR